MQGLVALLSAREILLCGTYVPGPRMAGLLPVCVAVAISALYELIEWWVALAGLALLSRLQDRQMRLF